MDLCPFPQVTNHLTRDRDGRRFKPALGRSWSFVPSTRILLDVTKGAGTLGRGQRTVCLTKSPRQVSQLGTPGILGPGEGGSHAHCYLTEGFFYLILSLPLFSLSFQPTGLQEVIDIGTLGTEEQSPELPAKQT